MSEQDIPVARSAPRGVAMVQETDFPELPLLEDKLSTRFLRQVMALPLEDQEHAVVVAMANPGDEYVLKALRA